ncbi:MAG: T9SS C-terminal target domain-containing protein [Bacteroidetes bacterium]|nr:MAG: T9SS C-terminal target domain-containing protein [Bacteroidota bacterium]
MNTLAKQFPMQSVLMKSKKENWVSGWLLLTVFIFFIFQNPSQAQTVAINEVMASNASTIADEDGDFEDWIELYNYGENPVNLNGYGLSDNYDNPMKWVFPDITIGPGEFLLVWASGKDRMPSDHLPNYINGLRRDVYNGIPGAAVSDLINHPSYPDQPSSSNILTGLFEAPTNIGDYYGQRIHGLIKAPATGNYTFWIASDDNGALYLSSTSNPEDTVLIASVPGWTNPRQWNKYTQQQSAPITLQEGNYYYVMAFMKEHEGGDNLAVGWRLPDSSFDRPINGQHLFRASSELHTNFSISSSGEELILTDPDGNLISELQPVSIPTDISYGRVPDGTGDWFYFSEPTPGLPNTSEAYSEILTPPQFSSTGGFYSQDFELSLTHPDSEAQIIYTIDGSLPDLANINGKEYPFKNYYPRNPGDPFGDTLFHSYHSHIYNSPIPIYDRSPEPDKLTQISSTWDNHPWYSPSSPVKKGITVRAKAIKQGAVPSMTETQTFFVTPDGENPYSLPIFTLSIQEDELFNYFTGIYVAGQVFDTWRASNPNAYPNGGTAANYRLRGIEQERPAHLEYFEATSTNPTLKQDFGLRIHGGWSRAHPMKSLRLYARNRYGTTSFNHPFFPDRSDSSFKRLILRNTGNDYWSAYLRDAVYQKMVKHLDFGIQAYQPALVFINGEYWGMTNIRERFDKHYVSRLYDVDTENIDMINVFNDVIEGNTQHYSALHSFIQNNSPALTENYDYITTQMDISSFTDSQIANIFVANTDWPGNNIRFWRLRTPDYIAGAPKGHDGRWRWLLIDTDFGLGWAESSNHNTLAFATQTNGPSWPNPDWSTLILRRMLENESFRIHFINRFADLLNTTFLPQRLSAGIEQARQLIEPEMQQHINRWKTPASNVNQWNNNVNAIFQFVEQRPSHQRNHIRSHFNLAGQLTLTLDVNDEQQGMIRLNTIDISASTPGIEENPYPWSGIYFSGIPVEAEAIPNEGFSFSHWEGDIASVKAKVQFTPSGNTWLKAHFIPAGDEPSDELLHYWHFNNLSGTATSIASDYSFHENGVITYPGSGDGFMDSRTHRPEDPVSNINLLMGQQPDQGAVLRARNPSRTRQLIIDAPTTGYNNIRVAFATTRTPNGAKRQSLHYSPDGGITWKPTEQGYEIPLLPEWEYKEFNLTGIQEVEDNPNLQFKILFWGESATGTSGNNRFDNISISGTTYGVGVDEIGKTNTWLNLYPNPAENYFILSMNPSDFREGNLEIFTSDGRYVRSIYITSPETTITVNDLSPGIYIITFTNSLHKISKRLVIQ